MKEERKWQVKEKDGVKLKLKKEMYFKRLKKDKRKKKEKEIKGNILEEEEEEDTREIKEAKKETK